MTAIAAIKARLDRAARDGEIDAATDTKALAAYYAAVVQGLSIQARDGVSRKTLESIATAALSVWPARRAR